MTVRSAPKSPAEVPWSRLIRFEGEGGQIHFGDAIVPNNDFDVGAPANLPYLKAKLITGNPLSFKCQVTDTVVKVLLGPLTSSMVPAGRCIGGNYGAHRKSYLTKKPCCHAYSCPVKELGIKPSRFTTMFPKALCSVAGYGNDVEIPKIAQDDQADCEGELTVVIGRDAKNVSVEDALDYVLGYTVANDVPAR